MGISLTTTNPERPAVKLIAMDLDGTLLTWDKQIAPRTEKALKKAAAMGIRLVISTGRPLSSLPECVEPMKDLLRYAITSNGAGVYDRLTGDRLFACLVPAEAAEAVFSALPGYSRMEVLVDGIAYGPEDYVRDATAYGLNEWGAGYIRRTRKGVADILSFAWQHKNQLDCINLVPADEEELGALRRRLSRIPSLYMTSSGVHLLEISGTGSGKARGLAYLGKYFGILPEEMMAFGDGENDVEMIRFAGRGVAMENGSEEAKSACDLIAPGNDEDGVAAVIEEHVLPVF